MNQVWLVYKDTCPECEGKEKGEVIRQLFPRYDFCTKDCGILLHIPSWREPEKMVSAVCWQIGDGPIQKMITEHYESLSAAVSVFVANH